VNARNTFEALFTAGALPIVNENDTVATDEIRVGDNDTLAALVTNLIDADTLLLLSDVAGLFDKNPSIYPEAQLIERVERIDAPIRAMAGGAGTATGTGGMQTKLAAAEIATSSGSAMWIAQGRRPHVIADCLAGVPGVGTYFAPSAKRPSARKRWLAWASGAPKGTLVVNRCARRALEEEGRSLLPVGIVDVSGNFAVGDTVAICDETGELFARGLAQYTSDEAKHLMGVPTNRLAEILQKPIQHEEIVHRDSLALLLL
jgi:glutamate 5-kinase